jgi:predicted transcriptional regulator
MKKHDCGVVPVVNAQNKVVGMITDRDICLALGPRPLPAAGIPVTEVMSRRVYACGPGEEIPAALRTMKNKRVRRLPVIDNGRLVGILSMDDVVMRAEASTEQVLESSEVDYGQTVDTLKAIYDRPRVGKEIIAHL